MQNKNFDRYAEIFILYLPLIQQPGLIAEVVSNYMDHLLLVNKLKPLSPLQPLPEKRFSRLEHCQAHKKHLFLILNILTPLCVNVDSIKNILSTKSCCSLRAISEKKLYL